MLVVLAAGYGQGAAQPTSPNQKHPPHPDVVSLEEQISSLATNEKAKAQLRAAHKSWLNARAMQCAGSAQPSLQECLALQDQERITSLKRLKLSLLLQDKARPKPSPPPPGFVAAVRSDGGVTAIASNEAAAMIVAVHYQKIAVIDTATAKIVREIPLGKRYDQPSLSIFPNGRVAMLTYFGTRNMHFVDLKDGQMLSESPRAMGPSVIVPGGRAVAYADGEALRFYDPLTDRDVSASFPHNGETIRRMAVSPDGKQLATLTTQGTLVLWDIAYVTDRQTYMLTRAATADTKSGSGYAGASAITFSKTGEWIFTASSHHSDAAMTRWSAADLRTMETVSVGRIRNEMLARLPSTDILVTAGSHSELGSYLMFLDMDARTVALTEAPRNFLPAVATTSSAQYLYSSTVYEVRRVDAPAASAFQGMETKLAQLRPKPVEPPKPQVQVPVLKDFPHDATIEGVFVYEGGGPLQESVRTQSGMRRAVSVDLLVGKTAKPLALVLGSYESVVWNIRASPDARITHVFLAGYHESVVRGAPNVQIHHLNTRFWYPGEDAMLRALNEAVYLQTGKKVEAVRGSYKGIRYYFGSGAPEPDREPAAASSAHQPAGIRNRCLDKDGKVVLTDRRCSDLGYRYSGVVVDSDNLVRPGGGIAVSPDVANCQIEADGSGMCTLNGGDGDTIIIHGVPGAPQGRIVAPK
jgi:hypothetical protein